MYDLLFALVAAGALALALAGFYILFEITLYLIYKRGPRGLVAYLKKTL